MLLGQDAEKAALLLKRQRRRIVVIALQQLRVLVTLFLLCLVCSAKTKTCRSLASHRLIFFATKYLVQKDKFKQIAIDIDSDIDCRKMLTCLKNLLLWMRTLLTNVFSFVAE